ncbi:MAG: DUF1553 domain-containing protein [Chthoniobacter sp.]|nr:DUF1553 domain-containing protein [Chthoniobacter sp.]
MALTGTQAAQTPITPEGRDFFENKIRPVLAAECNECHSAAKHKGGLRLDYRGGWEKGGDTGDTIVPGNAAKSLLIKSIRHEDPDLKMPAKSPKLDDKIIADFEKWVNMGAPDPRDQPPAEHSGKPAWPDLLAARRTWWSLQPVQKPTVPEVKNIAWSANPVDRFLLAKMEEHGLAPATDADPRTLIRRLTFTLTGLPPTPAEVDAFVADSAQDPHAAVQKATDRLLASPRFGEHWARHWLDLVRYAETHGSEGDPEIIGAWRYRDYMIRALNADVPVDQIIRENLAGDLLAHPRVSADGIDESMLGTAQFRLVEHGFQPVDTLDDQVKAVDNQIDVVSKAFQSLTVSCARCHDHKFDAISQRDYYALYGIFASCRPAQVTIDTPEMQAKNREPLEHLHAQIKSALADAWLKSADQIATRLRDASTQAAKSQEIATRIHDLEQHIADLDWTARHALKEQTAAPVTAQKLPAPIASWSFEKDASDAFGNLNGHLEGGAEVRDGRLILDGKGAYFRTDALPVNLAAKALEAWVTPTTLDQRGGGVISVESTDVHGFDSIVFAEREPRHWYAGSNFGIRSENVGGPEETAKAGELIHLAIVYGADNSITIYRNGALYGHTYNKAEMKKFEAGKSRILLGLRHKGAGSGFFSGEIEEARLYDRALTAEEVAASFHAGAVPVITPDQVIAALSPEQRAQRAALSAEIEHLRKESAANPSSEAWAQAMADAATNQANPLYLWAQLGSRSEADLSLAWQKLVGPLRARLAEARQTNHDNAKMVWNLAGSDYAKWFPYGPGLTPQPLPAGEFSVEADGDRILDGLAPGGALTARLSDKHTGILTSPRFKIETDSISVRAFGTGGAMARVIVDNYPLPSNPIFPKAILDKSEPGWVRLDTAYRKGSYAYIEFATREDLTRPLQDKKDKSKTKPNQEEPSSFGVEQVVFHDGKDAPSEEYSALSPLLDSAMPQSVDELAQTYRRVIADAVNAWRHNQLTESQRMLLDALVHREVLPATLTEVAAARPLVAQYRQLEADVPLLHHAPGLLETVAYDAPLLPRGDHLKPGEPVPRAYLEVFGGQPYHTAQSGRRELADAIANPQNPLTARVMVNRVWYWLFGRGIVATVDNFGRMGEKPTHPELLDYLATRFVENGWSIKDTIRYLVATRAFAMSSEPSPSATGTDPANDWLSHMRVRRLEAESIRDSILAASGQLDDQMFGRPADINGPRRSIYLPIRRTSLNPFLQTFDAPKPFTTLGRRDSTNVPGQSLTMLNSLFVIDESGKWARQLVKDDSDCADTRIKRMFAIVFARPPTASELTATSQYLEALTQDHKILAKEVLTSVPVWQDFAQSLFNLKEFIYLR